MPATDDGTSYVQEEEGGSKHGGPAGETQPLERTCCPPPALTLTETGALLFFEAKAAAGTVMVRPSGLVVIGGAGPSGFFEAPASAARARYNPAHSKRRVF